MKVIIGDPILTCPVFYQTSTGHEVLLGKIKGENDLGYRYYPQNATAGFEDETGNPIAYNTMEEIKIAINNYYGTSWRSRRWQSTVKHTAEKPDPRFYCERYSMYELVRELGYGKENYNDEEGEYLDR